MLLLARNKPALVEPKLWFMVQAVGCLQLYRPKVICQNPLRASHQDFQSETLVFHFFARMRYDH